MKICGWFISFDGPMHMWKYGGPKIFGIEIVARPFSKMPFHGGSWEEYHSGGTLDFTLLIFRSRLSWSKMFRLTDDEINDTKKFLAMMEEHDNRLSQKNT